MFLTFLQNFCKYLSTYFGYRQRNKISWKIDSRILHRICKHIFLNKGIFYYLWMPLDMVCHYITSFRETFLHTIAPDLLFDLASPLFFAWTGKINEFFLSTFSENVAISSNFGFHFIPRFTFATMSSTWLSHHHSSHLIITSLLLNFMRLNYSGFLDFGPR